MAPLRALSRLVTLLLLVALAAAGAAFAIGSLKINHDLSLPGMAEHLHLARLSHQTGGLIHALEASGPVALRTALTGAGAALLGLLLIAGALWPRRERLVLLEEGDEGRLAARRRPLRRLARALAARAEGVRPSRVRVRAGRRRGLGVRLVREPGLDPDEARARAESALAPLTGGFALPTAVRSRREWRR
jgi:hypothetical protein